MPTSLDDFRRLCCELGDTVRDEVLAHRHDQGLAGLSRVVGQVAADTIYAVDRVGEDRVLEWFDRCWPASEPVRLVMEGIDDDQFVTSPTGSTPDDVKWICVIDPIDGTRNLMFDKRSAWVLIALAPVRRPGASVLAGASGGRPTARLTDIVVAAMTEIPTTRQWRADQVSVVKGAGPSGIVAEGVDVRAGGREPIRLRPSTVSGLDHGFASFSHYLPDAKALLATIEQHLWDDLVPPTGAPRQIFEDQYICSAGQLHEIASGRDRVVGDLRPLALAHLGLPPTLTCHPYDVCCSLVLTEAGGRFEDPWGGVVDVPLDTTTPVAWVAYANDDLANLVRPALARALYAVLG